MNSLSWNGRDRKRVCWICRVWFGCIGLGTWCAANATCVSCTFSGGIMDGVLRSNLFLFQSTKPRGPTGISWSYWYCCLFLEDAVLLNMVWGLVSACLCRLDFDDAETKMSWCGRQIGSKTSPTRKWNIICKKMLFSVCFSVIATNTDPWYL